MASPTMTRRWVSTGTPESGDQPGSAPGPATPAAVGMPGAAGVRSAAPKPAGAPAAVDSAPAAPAAEIGEPAAAGTVATPALASSSVRPDSTAYTEMTAPPGWRETMVVSSPEAGRAPDSSTARTVAPGTESATAASMIAWIDGAVAASPAYATSPPGSVVREPGSLERPPEDGRAAVQKRWWRQWMPGRSAKAPGPASAERSMSWPCAYSVAQAAAMDSPADSLRLSRCTSCASGRPAAKAVAIVGMSATGFGANSTKVV